ncbi:MAG: hypothetical protein PF637_06740 [Spirochaetes bacterium]|jgi:PleD family two-component response regulator|nr:hypothetical protein [Spirochaetota bacterium]
MKELRGKSYAFEDYSIEFTFSAGVSDTQEIPASELSAESIEGNADRKLYEVKEDGRNRVVF